MSESWSLSWILPFALLTGASALALPSFTLIQRVDIMVTARSTASACCGGLAGRLVELL